MKYKIVKEYFGASNIDKYVIYKKSVIPFLWSYCGYEFTLKEAEQTIERRKIVAARRKKPEVVGYY